MIFCCQYKQAKWTKTQNKLIKLSCFPVCFIQACLLLFSIDNSVQGKIQPLGQGGGRSQKNHEPLHQVGWSFLFHYIPDSPCLSPTLTHENPHRQHQVLYKFLPTSLNLAFLSMFNKKLTSLEFSRLSPSKVHFLY